MAMRLLKKSEVVELKAKEQKNAIDEGLTLARRIDALRETLADEECSLTAFREKTLAQIHEDTQKADLKKEKLLTEVKELEERKAEAQKPLDEAWKTLREEQIQLAEDRTKLDEQRHELHDIKLDLRTKHDLLASERQHVQSNKDRTHRLLVDTDNAAKKAKLVLANTRKAWAENQRKIETAYAELKERDTALAVKERNVSLREASLKIKEQELERAWKKLTDRNAMLERNLKRYGQPSR